VRQDHLDPRHAGVTARGEDFEALAERAYPVVVLRFAVAHPVQTVQERRDLQDPRPVLDEIFVDELLARLRRWHRRSCHVRSLCSARWDPTRVAPTWSGPGCTYTTRRTRDPSDPTPSPRPNAFGCRGRWIISTI